MKLWNWLLLSGLWVWDACCWFESKAIRHRGGRPKLPWVVEAVLRLYAQGCSYRNVRDEFNRLYAHQGMTVSLNTVYKWVQKYASKMEAVRRETRNRFPRFALANLCWCLDGTGKEDALGGAFHSRDSRSRDASESGADAPAILEQIFRAVEKFGKPRTIRTDNAPVFHSAIFEEGLAAAGMRHEFSAPGKPWQNGRIERLFLTLKEKLNQIVPEEGLALNSLLAEFSFWYNPVRPHQHLHGFTPMEVWTGVNPYKTAPKAVLRFEGWGRLLRGLYIRR